MAYLPITIEEIKERGWNELDFILVTGDAYVDHSSFGIAIIGRELEALGYKVAILAQPKPEVKEFKKFGEPRLGFMITSGNIDSMVSNYTVSKRKRNEDAYSPTDLGNCRPDRAGIVYSLLAKEAYPNKPVILGGIEASLRRFAHYDYWSDSVMPSIMVSAKADMISFGMGERQTEEIARRLNNGEKIESMTNIRGTVVYIDEDKIPENAVKVASFKKISEDKKAFAKAYKMELDEQDNVVGKPLVQKHGDRLILQNPPARLLTREELDKVYTLHFEGNYHPYYEQFGGVKAIEEVKFSIMHNRGCFGHCNFCSIAVHQGRQIVSRSIDSCLGEAEALSKREDFKGYIHDVGGPTADFRYPSCKKQEKLGMCKDRKCLGTDPCKAIICDHSEYLELLRRMRSIKGVKKVFIRSGLRFDYMLLDKDDEFLNEIVKYHISGQLRVAPEHCSKNVLEMMGKPPIEVYNKFSKKFYKATKAVGKEQYIVPYLMSSHPGSTINDAIELSLFLKKNNLKPEQVQDFYPTPFTISTCMFYTGINPLTMEEVYVPKTEEEKREQRALLQYYRPENHDTVLKALKTAKRFDLIGVGPNCLVADNIKNKKEVKIYRNNFAEPSLTTKGGRTKNHENKKKR